MSEPALSPTTMRFPQQQQSLPWWEAVPIWSGLEQVLAVVWDTGWDSRGKLATVPGCFNLLLLTCFWD